MITYNDALLYIALRMRSGESFLQAHARCSLEVHDCLSGRDSYLVESDAVDCLQAITRPPSVAELTYWHSLALTEDAERAARDAARAAARAVELEAAAVVRAADERLAREAASRRARVWARRRAREAARLRVDVDLPRRVWGEPLA